MKLIVAVALALVAVAMAAPVDQPLVKEPTKILRSDFQQNPDGGYDFYFETDDGTKRQESGIVDEYTDEDNKVQKVIIVKGQYSYINKDGTEETVTYSGDRTGFHPEGSSIPKVDVPVASR